MLRGGSGAPELVRTVDSRQNKCRTRINNRSTAAKCSVNSCRSENSKKKETNVDASGTVMGAPGNLEV